ncbi:uncharacterized protein AC631_02169 [Debaryomyces fabryi]|uniref:NADH-ubiquinone oxidoreductase 14 kDa subunit n=1 Tax=Debaryomyces fabryi TaxID=58627 RepID=A0A0V1Q1L8_9ASCO|nr:uncharacterized protein AC631_02169 [Debaryomyces fabryi]KSA02095.1 hypothetical protein AC631_02169 [Debaryomyces fabryi]CUM51147.1 unnamed protein product [Debaryomyces fabryi]
MVVASPAGILVSGFLGLITRRMQVLIVGKEYPRSFNRVPGYLYSVGAFVGGYLIFSNIVENNRELLDRRLTILREQRALKDAFHEFKEEPDHRFISEKRGRFFKLMDKFSTAEK